MDIRLRFDNPIVASDASVKNTIVYIPRHFLSADEQALDFVVVDAGKVRSRRELDVVAGLSKKFAGRFLQTASRDTQFQ